MGRFEVRPVYVAEPGGMAEKHLGELLVSRWRRPSKHVWIVAFSTTPDRSVTRVESLQTELDHEFIGEQLGYLNLPLAVLGLPRRRRPALVIATIAKFDLYSEHEPNSRQAANQRAALEHVFGRHVSRLKDACDAKRVPFKLEITSAARGWRVESMSRHIKETLYS
jgi:hypothetical protein